MITLRGLCDALLHTVFAFFGVALTALLLCVAGYIGFVAYIVTLKPALEIKADAIVVLTGGPHRIEEGLRRLADGAAPALFISGVHKDTTKHDILVRNVADPSLWVRLDAAMQGRITLGQSATTTEENAAEVADWVASHPARRILLITAQSHMPRAHILLHRAMPQVEFIDDAVKRHADGMRDQDFWRDAGVEYVKTLLTLLNPQSGTR